MTFCKLVFNVLIFLCLYILYLLNSTFTAMNVNEVCPCLLIGKYLLAMLMLVITILMLFKFYKDYAVVDMDFCTTTCTRHANVLSSYSSLALFMMYEILSSFWLRFNVIRKSYAKKLL